MRSVFTSLCFFTPSSPACFTCFRVSLQAYWFFKTACAVFSRKVDWISCTSTLRRQTATSAGAGMALCACQAAAAHGVTYSSAAWPLSLWDLRTGGQRPLPHQLWAPRAGENPDVTPASGTSPGASWQKALDKPHQTHQCKHQPSMCSYRHQTGPVQPRSSCRITGCMLITMTSKSRTRANPQHWFLLLLVKWAASPFSPPQPAARQEL